MKTMRGWVLTLLIVMVAGCGGESPSPSSHGFMTPTMNTQRTYVVTDINGSSTSINTVLQTVTSVNADGSYAYSESVAGGTVNGPNYLPGNYTVDNNGHLLTFTPTSVVEAPCSATPRGPGPVFPVTVGETWQWTYGYRCAPAGSPALVTMYAQNGSVADLESLTAAAGTFSVIKLQSTISWGCAGACTESLTEWREASSGALVKSTATYDYRNTLPLPITALGSETRELLSQ